MSTDIKKVFAARKERLNAWIASHYGKPVDFQKLTGINQGLLSSIQGGSKSFGEKIALNIELSCAKVADKPAMPKDYLFYPFDQSQPLRLSPEILAEAIAVAKASKGGLTAEKIAAAYELIIGRTATVIEFPESTPPTKPKGPAANDIIDRGNPGTLADTGRARGKRSK